MIAESIPRAISLEEIPLELIDIGSNVRVDAGELEEMASSIRELGVLQPVKVNGPLEDGRYRLLWGQRRVLASRLAERITIPAIVNPERGDEDRPIEQLVENLQRADLNPIEEATALRDVLAGDRTLTQATLATKLGRSQAWIANTIGLLKAPEVIRTAIVEGTLTASHAKAVSGLPAKEAERLGQLAIEQGYSAHELERNAKYAQERQKDLEKRSKGSDAAAQRAIATLREADVPSFTPVVIHGSWQYDPDRIAKLVEEAGFTVEARSQGARSAGCDCTGVAVEIQDGKGSKIVEVCTSAAHREAAYQASRAEQDARAELVKKDAVVIAKAVKVAVRAQPPHPAIVRLLLRTIDSYSGEAWSHYAKLTDAQALDQLIERISLRAGTAYGKELPAKSVLAALAGKADTPA